MFRAACFLCSACTYQSFQEANPHPSQSELGPSNTEKLELNTLGLILMAALSSVSFAKQSHRALVLIADPGMEAAVSPPTAPSPAPHHTTPTQLRVASSVAHSF